MSGPVGIAQTVRRAVVRARAAMPVIALMSASTVLAAEEKFAAPQVAERIATPGAGSLVQVTLSLMLVLGAVFVAAWLVRRLKSFGKYSSGPIEIIADVSVGTKERAVLVQVGGKQLLLGVAPGRVNTLHVLDEPVGIDTVKTLATGNMAVRGTTIDGAQRQDFKAILRRSLGL